MTKNEIIAEMGKIRATLQKDQAQLLTLQDHMLGCTVLMERLAVALARLEEPKPEEKPEEQE